MNFLSNFEPRGLQSLSLGSGLSLSILGGGSLLGVSGLLSLVGFWNWLAGRLLGQTYMAGISFFCFFKVYLDS